jgi:hypothetical protein
MSNVSYFSVGDFAALKAEHAAPTGHGIACADRSNDATSYRRNVRTGKGSVPGSQACPVYRYREQLRCFRVSVQSFNSTAYPTKFTKSQQSKSVNPNILDKPEFKH